MLSSRKLRIIHLPINHTSRMQFLYRLVGFDPTKYNLRTELMAGLTTFLTMGYILAVNPDLLSAPGMD